MKSYLQNLYRIAVEQALPEYCLPPHLSKIDASNGLCVLGAGKASVKMAQATHRFFGDKCFGAVVTRHGYTEATHVGNIEVLKGGHPIPDEASAAAAEKMLQLASECDANIPVLFLISGGGSALMSLPIDGLPLATKIDINRFLLGCGASIHEINTVRKQLSKVKGGKLGQAINGPHYSYIISDVVGDDPSFIASGPTVPDTSTPQQALSILKRYNNPYYEQVSSLLANVSNDSLANNKHDKPRNTQLPGEVAIIANAEQSIDAAITQAKADGWEVEVIDYQQEGEARKVAQSHAQIALQALKEKRAVMFFSGGELTVSLNNTQGAGGPNQEYALALAMALKGAKGISALACDTDGVDGNRDVAGAYIDENTLQRSDALGLKPEQALANNESFAFFQCLDDLIITGPTHTNVNDFRVIVVNPVNTTP